MFDPTGFEAYKRECQHLLKEGGWSNRGIFHALKNYRVADAHARGETAWAWVERVDREAPFGMAAL